MRTAPLVLAKAGTQGQGLDSRFRGNERSLVRAVSHPLVLAKAGTQGALQRLTFVMPALVAGVHVLG